MHHLQFWMTKAYQIYLMHFLAPTQLNPIAYLFPDVALVLLIIRARSLIQKPHKYNQENQVHPWSHQIINQMNKKYVHHPAKIVAI